MTFGGTGKTRATKLEEARKADEAKHRASKGLFTGGGTLDTGGALSASGNVPTITFASPAQERRMKAEKAAAEKARAARAEEEAIARRSAAARAQKAEDNRKAEQARKAAAKAQAEKAEAEMIMRRAAFLRDCKRSLVIKTNIPPRDLTADTTKVFGLLVHQYRNAGNRPVKLTAKTAADALGLREATVTTALNTLKGKGWVVEAVDTFGVTKIMPASHAIASVAVEEAA